MIHSILFIKVILFTHLIIPLDTGNRMEDHAIYISVIELEKLADQSEASLKVKIFMDDLQDAIHHHSGLRKSYRTGCKEQDAELMAYFNDHLILFLNTKPVTIHLMDCEKLEDSLWLNFLFQSPQQWNDLKITADYLMELFPTQTNVISVNYEGERQFSRLNKVSPSVSFTFSR